MPHRPSWSDLGPAEPRGSSAGYQPPPPAPPRSHAGAGGAKGLQPAQAGPAPPSPNAHFDSRPKVRRPSGAGSSRLPQGSPAAPGRGGGGFAGVAPGCVSRAERAAAGPACAPPPPPCHANPALSAAAQREGQRSPGGSRCGNKVPRLRVERAPALSPAKGLPARPGSPGLRDRA